MVLPDKWGNYSPTPNYNSGVCAECGHDVSKHASRMGTCMAGTCSCVKFVQAKPSPSPIIVSPLIPPQKKRQHGRKDHETLRDYLLCPICKADRVAEE